MSPYRTIVAYCPHCKQKIREERVPSNTPEQCGCPTVTCPHCHMETTDDTITELALHPREWYRTHYLKPGVFIPLLFLPWVLLTAAGLLGAETGVFRSLSSFGLGVLVVGILVFSHIPAFRYAQGRTSIRMDEAFELRYRESEERLRDPAYLQFLIDDGYLKRHNIEETL